MNRTLSLFCLCLLPACGGGQPAPELYTLQAEAPTVATCHAPSGTIKLHEPIAAPGLESAHIVVIDRPNHQTFYRGVRWNGSAPEVVQHYLADSFEQSGLFKSVATDTGSARAQWVLESQLHRFQIDQSGGTRKIDIRLTAQLIEQATHRTLLTMPLAVQQDVSGQSLDGIVAAFNRSMAELSTQMLTRMHQRLPGC